MILPSHAWPGGYPIYYVDKENSILCPDCANTSADNERLVQGINYESTIYCDECSKEIESAYEVEKAHHTPKTI